MTYLIDSDRVAEYLKGRAEALELLHRLARQELAISVVSYGELLEGIYYGNEPDQHERDFRALLRWMDLIPLSETIFERFAGVRGQLRRRGQLIGDLDLLIGLTAVEHDLTLVTGNLRHYERIPELHIYR